MESEVVTHTRYKNAFNCKRCPQSSKEDGCPAWWEQVWTDKANGNQVIKSGCGFTMSQALMVELIQTAHRPAAEISQMKKEVVDGVERATVAVLEFQRAKEAAISSGDLAGYNLDPRGLVRFNEWDDNSDSKDSRDNLGK
jgi:hypothetical protein